MDEFETLYLVANAEGYVVMMFDAYDDAKAYIEKCGENGFTIEFDSIC